MPTEKSAGAVIFRKENNELKYLLLHYPSSFKSKRNYWDFPKGHIEAGENEIETVKREVEEETSLKDIEIVAGFKEVIKYFFRAQGKTVFKTVVFYLAATKTDKVKISGEHTGYQWLSYEKALNQLTFKNAKNIITKANDYLIASKSLRCC